MPKFITIWLAACASLFVFPDAVLQSAEKEIRFSRDILPILSDNCFHCHGPDSKKGRKGDLSLDDKNDVFRDRDGHAVVKPGKPEESELYNRLISEDPDEAMPPESLGRKLTADQKNLIKAWISQGGKWGKHWSFERVERPEIPEVDKKRNAIDVLVSQKAKEQGLTLNPRADKITLIRRLSLDLTGLPPTQQEVDEFIKDESPQAWEKLVDRKLASKAFGERMAWDWMDVARYADSNGYQGDNDRLMWPWRDWIVKAFNTNLPYDQFTVWQLAGDLLPNKTEEQLLATAFNRNHMINGEGGRIPEENRVDYVFDMTETMGTAWLGLTLNCCRCHDHKYDPVKQKEYYELTAFFNQTPVTGGGSDPFAKPSIRMISSAQTEQMSQLNRQKSEYFSVMDNYFKKGSPDRIAWEKKILDKYPRASWKIAEFQQLVSTEGQTLTPQANKSVIVTGNNPEHDTYLLVTRPEMKKVTGLWLEALRHTQMNRENFSRGFGGSFVISEVSVRWRPNTSSNWNTVKLAKADATFKSEGYKPEFLLDHEHKTGWGKVTDLQMTNDEWVVFTFEKPIVTSLDAEFEIQIDHQGLQKEYNLGCFRVSLTDEDKITLPNEEARIARTLLLAVTEKKDEFSRELKYHFEAMNPESVKTRAKIVEVDNTVKQLENEIPKVMVMEDMKSTRKTYILDRGLYTELRDEVSAQTPAFLTEGQNKAGQNRLDLAKWLVSRDHPLTSRVTVNRYWQMFFGIGLVKTSEDFGLQGEAPPQKELLDWLAAEFMESGWNIKHLVKTIVMSETYQRSSKVIHHADLEKDPVNRFLARGPRFRLPSWMIRDQALAISGLINLEQGGKPVFPYQPEGIWDEATFGKKSYVQDHGDKLYRRSLYAFWRRIVGPTLFFDNAKRQNCEVKPLRTNTPMHALVTLNDVTYVEASRFLAQNILNDKLSLDDRLKLLGKKVLYREPSAQELAIWKKSLNRGLEKYKQNNELAEKFVQTGETPVDKTLPIDELAAWTGLTLNLLNLDEVLNKE